MAIPYAHDHEHEITLFAETNFRNERRRFGIKTDDRRRHMYVIGKTGMGKTTLMENLIMADVYAGHGCCYIDPHGDTAEKLIDFIPSNRINDVVYFNPADTAFPMGFNILETEAEWQKPLVASGLMGVFKKIWPDVWSARMEYILMNCVLALLDYPGSTLLGINRLLVDKEYRARVVTKIRDPIVKTFWVAEFASWSEKYATEAIAAVQNKVGQFLSSSVIRNIVAQVKSTIDIRHIMDDGKILITNLSKGRIGEDNMRLLGGMLITKIQLAAQERQNIPLEEDRRDFYLYVDEFQNFSNESFATILSEARKYRLNLIVAHQYIEQLDEKVAAGVFGNMGTIIVMRVGAADATAMEMEFAPTFTPEDLVNLAKHQIYIKLLVDGVSTSPFSANTLPPLAKRTGNGEKIILVSRERYAEPRASIEEKVLKWSGMEAAITPMGSAETGPLQDTRQEMTGEAIQYPAIRTDDEQRETPAAPAEYLTLKPERLAMISAQAGQTKKSGKPQFPHTCTRCGKIWTLAVQLDPTRPMYCPECRPIVAEERKRGMAQVKQVRRSLPPSEEAMAAATAVEELPLDVGMTGPHRPRLVPAPDRREPRQTKRAEKTPAKDLLAEVMQAKGQARVQINKQELERRAGEPARSSRRPSAAAVRRTEPMKKKIAAARVASLAPPSPDAFVPSSRRSAPWPSETDLDLGLPPAPPIAAAPINDGDVEDSGQPVAPGQRVKFHI